MQTSGNVAYGEVVWSRRPDCWRQVLERLNASRGRWWQEAPIHQGERDINRKAIAQGRPECFRFTCMLVCALPCASIAHETAGAARTRSSLRPLLRVACALLLLGGRSLIANLGHSVSRERESMSSFRGERSESPESITPVEMFVVTWFRAEHDYRGYGFRACAKWRIPE